MSRKNNKKKLKANSKLLLPVLYNNPDGDDVVYDIPIGLPQGLSKKKCVKGLKHIFKTYVDIEFSTICEMQGWKYLIQWDRGNYEYL